MKITSKYADFKENLSPVQLMCYLFVCVIVFVLLYIVDGHFGLTMTALLGEISFGGIICYSFLLIMMLLNVSFLLRKFKWWQVLFFFYVLPIAFIVAFIGFYNYFFAW